MVVIGIDASTTSTGVSVFDNLQLLYYTTIKGIGDNWREKLFSQGSELIKIIELYHPTIAYMEDVPLKKNGGLQTLVILGAVQGFIYGIMSTYAISVEFLSPTKWRSSLHMFNGTIEGKKRDVLKEKAVNLCNDIFGLNLIWAGPYSKKSEDDVAEAILVAFSQIRFKKPKSQ